MVKKSILIMAIVLAIGAGIAGGYFIFNEDHYIFPPPPDLTETSQEEQQPTKIIAEDNFVLAVHRPMSKEKAEEYQQWLEEVEEKYNTVESFVRDNTFPFNRFGWYWNYFYLLAGERVEIIMRSRAPMSIQELDESLIPHEGGKLFHINVGEGEIKGLDETILSNKGITCNIRRVDMGWELSFNFKVKESGNYWLWITNETPNQQWCQYAVILR
ncbi:MAG: hypothetical protein JRI56_13130 [Deltaproteobacteria bacterium]|nr:hypothetical protein [Deltaproteobacteria bacterium]